MNDSLQKGILALKEGNRATARQLLIAAIRQAPDNVQAWLWLSGAVDNKNERIDCLKQVLRLDPENEVAARGLAIIQKSEIMPGTTSLETVKFDESNAEEILDQEPENHKVNADLSTNEEGGFQESHITNTNNESRIHPNIRFIKNTSFEIQGEPIFQTRPSIAPTLIGFWCMVFITFAMTSLVQEGPQLELPLSLMTCGILGAVVIYILVIRLSTKYEVTNKNIILMSRGKRTMIPIPHILNVSHEQSWFQKRIGLGNILIEASVDGVLRQLRMYNLVESDKRTEQIYSLITN